MHTRINPTITASLFVLFCLPVLICSAAPSVSFVADTSSGWSFHPVEGDIARNNIVDINDLAVLAQNWLANGCASGNNWCSGADIDGSTGVDLVDYALLASDWGKQAARDVLLQTIYGTAQDSAGNITSNATMHALQNLKGYAMAFNVPSNTTLDKGTFKLTAVTAGKTMEIRLFTVTGKGYLTTGHTMSRSDPGSGSSAIVDVTVTIPSTVPYHTEPTGTQKFTDMVIDFGQLSVTAGDYLMTLDCIYSSSTSLTTACSVEYGTGTQPAGMGTYPNGTPLPKRATVTSSAAQGNTYFYYLNTSTDANYKNISQLFPFQITLANQPPVANTGQDQILQYPNNVASLAGTASDDGLPDPPGAVTTTWSKISGPGTVTFANANALNTTATFSDLGTYVLRLTASDSQLSSSDDITITYLQNQAPEVDAGIDRTVGIIDVTTLYGTATDDGYPNPPGALTISWTQQSGPGTVTFGNANAAVTTASFSTTGTYVLRLTANDGQLETYDEVTLTVVSGSVNNPPVVNAGPDQMIADPCNTVTLNAIAFDDGLPCPPCQMTVAWTKQSGPGPVTFGSSTSIVTTATFSTYGTYVLRLTASDSSLTSYDEVTIIYSPPDAAPVVNAGKNRIIADPVNSVNLSGTVTDDGLPNPLGHVTTTWTVTSGPGTVTFGDANAVNTTATFSGYGTYILRLTANDGILSSYDEMTVTYYAVLPPNQAPVVNAGLDKTAILPAMALLYGTVSDDNLPDPPATVTTLWTQQSGPATATITDATALVTTASFPQDGTYVFRLTANDSELSSYDEVTITVLPAMSQMVYHVTNLNNSGAGSLADCVSKANTDGVRSMIVFDVGGTIYQTTTLALTEPNTIICGDNAPSPGITIDCGRVCSGFVANASNGSFGHWFTNLHI